MHARGVGDFANHAVFINIDDHYFSIMAHVQAPPRFIDREIVPASLASDRDFFQQMILGGPCDTAAYSGEVQ